MCRRDRFYLDHAVAAAADQLAVVGDHQDGFPFVRFVPQHIGDDPHISPVQAAGGFIEDQHIPPGQDSAGQGEALLLSAGKGSRMSVFIHI